MLTKRLVAAQSDEEQAAVADALKIACQRSVDKESCARSLVACLPQASPSVRCSVLELLGSMGGPTALEAVSAATLEKDKAVQDVATLVLGQWRSPDAAPLLLDLTKKLPRGEFWNRAFRGCLRILRQRDLPSDQKIAICREAMQLAQQDSERALVLQTLGRIPSSKALPLVLPHLQTPSLNKAAGFAAVSVGAKIVSAEPATVARAMQEVLKTTKDPELARQAKDLLAETKPGVPSAR